MRIIAKREKKKGRRVCAREFCENLCTRTQIYCCKEHSKYGMLYDQPLSEKTLRRKNLARFKPVSEEDLE